MYDLQEDNEDAEEGESDDSQYESDDSELSFEDDSDANEDNEDQPSTSAIAKTKDSAKPQTSTSNKVKLSKTNGTAAPTNQKAVGQLLRKNKDKPNAVEAFKNELNDGKSDGKNGKEIDEYEEHDTDDEEDIRNTIGNIPVKWYDEYKHIGYDWDAKKIIKPERGDQLDDFLKRMEDPNFWRTVKDPQTGQEVVLSEADIELIKRINSQRIPDGQYDDYAVSSKPLSIFY